MLLRINWLFSLRYIVVLYFIPAGLPQSTDCIFGSDQDCYFNCNCNNKGDICDNNTGTCPSGCATASSNSPEFESRYYGPGCLTGNVALNAIAQHSAGYVYSNTSENKGADLNNSLPENFVNVTFLPDKATDGAISGFMDCAYAVENASKHTWITVSFDRTYVIERVSLYNFQNTWAEFNDTYLYLDSGVTITAGIKDDISTFKECGRLADQSTYIPIVDVKCSEHISADHVLIEKENNFLPICEVVVYGYPWVDVNCDKCSQSSPCNGIWCEECMAGYRPPFCNVTCEDNYYGTSCLNHCHCGDGSECDKMTGVCPDDCEIWYTKSDENICEIPIGIPNKPSKPKPEAVESDVEIRINVQFNKTIEHHLKEFYSYKLQYDLSPDFSNLTNLIVTQTTVLVKGLIPGKLYYFRIVVSRTHRGKSESGSPSDVVPVETWCTSGLFGTSCRQNCYCEGLCNRTSGECIGNCQQWYIKSGSACIHIELRSGSQIRLLEVNTTSMKIQIFDDENINDELIAYYQRKISYFICDQEGLGTEIPLHLPTVDINEILNIVIPDLKPFKKYCFKSFVERLHNGKEESGLNTWLNATTRCFPPVQPNFKHEILPKDTIYVFWGTYVETGQGCNNARITNMYIQYRPKTKYNNATWAHQTLPLNKEAIALTHMGASNEYEFQYVSQNNDNLESRSDIIVVSISYTSTTEVAPPSDGGNGSLIAVSLLLVIFVLLFLLVLIMWVVSYRRGQLPSPILKLQKILGHSTNQREPETSGTDGYTGLTREECIVKDGYIHLQRNYQDGENYADVPQEAEVRYGQSPTGDSENTAEQYPGPHYVNVTKGQTTVDQKKAALVPQPAAIPSNSKEPEVYEITAVMPSGEKAVAHTPQDTSQSSPANFKEGGVKAIAQKFNQEISEESSEVGASVEPTGVKVLAQKFNPVKGFGEKSKTSTAENISKGQQKEDPYYENLHHQKNKGKKGKPLPKAKPKLAAKPKEATKDTHQHSHGISVKHVLFPRKKDNNLTGGEAEQIQGKIKPNVPLKPKMKP